MHKRFKKSNLHRLLGNEPASEEVFGNHAYGKVARSHKVIPDRTRLLTQESQTVPNYRDSMVGSITQYRDRTPVPPKKPEEDMKDVPRDERIVGNRPRSGSQDKPSNDTESVRKRHHFIEPPKRNFNQFD